MKERKAHRCSLLRNWAVKVLRLIIFHDFSSSFAQEMNWFWFSSPEQLGSSTNSLNRIITVWERGLLLSTGIVLASAAHLFLLVSDIFTEITAQLLGRILLSLVMHTNSWDNLVVSYNLLYHWSIPTAQSCLFFPATFFPPRKTAQQPSCGPALVACQASLSHRGGPTGRIPQIISSGKKKSHHWWFSMVFPSFPIISMEFHSSFPIISHLFQWNFMEFPWPRWARTGLVG